MYQLYIFEHFVIDGVQKGVWIFYYNHWSIRILLRNVRALGQVNWQIRRVRRFEKTVVIAQSKEVS
jgi:hypothetical protein